LKCDGLYNEFFVIPLQKLNKNLFLIGHFIYLSSGKELFADFNCLDLMKLKNENYRYFCWTLASYFSNYLMNKNLGDVIYIDSDILFHHDLNIVLEAIGEKEVGIFRHRQFKTNRPEGFFNVGVVYFKDSELSRHVLSWWWIEKLIET
jgi:lipopolysaccharide biosynthesis glycosyltransferase